MFPHQEKNKMANRRRSKEQQMPPPSNRNSNNPRIAKASFTERHKRITSGEVLKTERLLSAEH